MKNLAQVLLTNIPSAQYASGKTEIVMKCPFCGDSPDPKSKHFYISLREGQPHFYNCFKCNSKGIVNSKFLRMISIYDNNAMEDIDRYNKSTMIVDNNSRFNYTKTKNIKNIIVDNELSRMKLLYINKRLGLNLNLEDLFKLKICPNILELLRINNINNFTRDIRVMEDLNKYFVGFISYDNNFINLRNLMPEDKVNKFIAKRYIIYNVFGDQSNSERFYTVPTNIDITKHVNINIAEGVFDILSVKYNLNPNNNEQNVFTAICGKNYMSAIEFYLCKLGLFNSTFHIYIDNDVSKYELLNLSKQLIPLNIDVYIHRNVYPEMKDFGVKREYIKEEVFPISSIGRRF